MGTSREFSPDSSTSYGPTAVDGRWTAFAVVPRITFVLHRRYPLIHRPFSTHLCQSTHRESSSTQTSTGFDIHRSRPCGRLPDLSTGHKTYPHDPLSCPHPTVPSMTPRHDPVTPRHSPESHSTRTDSTSADTQRQRANDEGGPSGPPSSDVNVVSTIRLRLSRPYVIAIPSRARVRPVSVSSRSSSRCRTRPSATARPTTSRARSGVQRRCSLR